MSAVARATRQAAESVDAEVVLVDVGPSLGAINRVAMVASDYVVVPLSPDLYSVQALHNLGPTLKAWRREWSERRPKNPSKDLWLPEGQMQPAGYVVLQHGVRVDRAVGAYDRWIRRVPAEYRESVLGVNNTGPAKAEDDPNCLGVVKQFHSLASMAEEARRPIFRLRSADGAIGAHQQAVSTANNLFELLTRRVLVRAGAPVPGSSAVS